MKMNENLIIKEQEKLLIKFKENVEELRARGILKEQALACINEAYEAVYYTHLTLPTNSRV